MTAPIVQQNQPDGVPPLELTGERTLPDVPIENYWYQRHVVVYRWIAEQVSGKRVIDMACGEGYGSDILAAAGAAKVTGVDANPEAHEHARLRYVRPNLSFARELVETYEEPCDAIVFLQTIEHVQEPEKLLERFASILAPGGVIYCSTPNVLTLAADGERSDNPWHVYEYKPEEFEAMCKRVVPATEIYGVWHANKLRVHELVLKAGWDRVHKTLRITKPFYDRFVPMISASDFKIAQGDLTTSLDLLTVMRP